MKLDKVHFYFWMTATLILLTGIISTITPEDNSVFNIHDTYYVIENIHLGILISLIFYGFGFCYWLLFRMKRKFNRRLVQIHCLITFGSFVLFWIQYLPNAISRHAFNVLSNADSLDVVTFGLIVFLNFIGQPLFVINMLIGVFSGKKDLSDEQCF